MDYYDKLRYEVKQFNYGLEKNSIDLTRSIDLKQSRKELKKKLALYSLASSNPYSPLGLIFTSSEDALRRGYSVGMRAGFGNVIEILNNAIKYAWGIELVEREVSNLIFNRMEQLKTVQEDHDDRKLKKIYQEMAFVSEVHFLMLSWRILFYKDQQLKDYLANW
jgi:hypothetical protein